MCIARDAQTFLFDAAPGDEKRLVSCLRYQVSERVGRHAAVPSLPLESCTFSELIGSSPQDVRQCTRNEASWYSNKLRIARHADIVFMTVDLSAIQLGQERIDDALQLL